MAAQHAFRPVPERSRRPAPPTPLAADTESGFGRLFIPTLVAVLVATGCLGWESWMAAESLTPGVIAMAR